MSIPTKNYGPEFLADLQAEADAVPAPEGGPSDDQLDAIADAHRWDTRDGRRAMLRAALAAQHQATLPTTLTDEMRAVLTNERCVYGSADELYAALLAAAPQTKEPTNDR